MKVEGRVVQHAMQLITGMFGEANGMFFYDFTYSLRLTDSVQRLKEAQAIFSRKTEK